MMPRLWRWWAWAFIGLSLVTAYVSLTGSGLGIQDGLVERTPLWILFYIALAVAVAAYPFIHVRKARRIR